MTTEDKLLFVLMGSVVIMLLVDMYLTYRNTILVCGQYTLEIFDKLNYNNPLLCAQCKQACVLNQTRDLIQSVKSLNPG